MSSKDDGSNVYQLLQQEIEQLQAELDEQKASVRQLTKANDYLQKKNTAVQQETITYGNNQARLETQLYAQEQDNNKLRKEIQLLTKAKKDAEKKLSTELQNFEADRLQWQQREADMYNQIRSLSALAEPRTPRTPKRRSFTNLSPKSPFNYPTSDNGEYNAQEEAADNAVDGNVSSPTTPKLASVDSTYAREAKIAQRTIKAQDKMIADLRNEIEKLKKALQDSTAEAQELSLRKAHFENELANVKRLNQSLMEENESYQILLHEKTISGEFMMNPIMQVDKDGQAPQDSRRSLKASSSTSSTSNGLNLAAELNLASVGTPDWEATQKANEKDQLVLKLSEELKTLQDTNRALQLYMNKILLRIINDKQLVDVLSIDQPKPRPAAATKTSTLQAKGQQQKEQQQQAAKAASAQPSAPTPSRTLSSTLLGKSSTSRQQRRRTISYWGKNAPQVPDSASEAAPATPEPNNRRHTTMVKETKQPPAAVTPTASTSTSTNGGWAKALRRMSGIGWSKSEDNLEDGNGSIKSVPEHATQKLQPIPATSRSSSTTTTSSSLRRSNELATLQEE